MSIIHTYDPRFSAIQKQQRNGKNASTMLQDNRNLILQLIRKKGPISRKQLSEMTGLQPATISIVMQKLLEKRLVCESGVMDGGNGRRVKTFSMTQNLYTIIVRLTSVYLKIALFDANVSPVYVKKMFFQTEDVISETMELIQIHIQEIEKIVNKESILCMMIGVEHQYRLIDNDYAVWDEIRQEYYPIGKKVHDLTGYQVFVNRAINFSCYDLWDRYQKFSKKDEPYTTMVCVQLGYDLEGAIIVNHELLYGKDGLCGQLRELKLDRNSDLTYKDVATVSSILKRTNELLKDYPDSYVNQKKTINIRDVIEGYCKGDKLCRIVYNEVAVYLGYIFGQILNWFDPDTILVEDEVPPTMEFVNVLQEEVAKYCGKEKSLRIGTLIGVERNTKNDPVLIGGSKYAFDLIIGDIGIF